MKGNPSLLLLSLAGLLLLLPPLAHTQSSYQVGFNGTEVGCGVGEGNYLLEGPNWPLSVTSPDPLVLTYNHADSTLTFSVRVNYLPTDSRYVIGFRRFDPTIGGDTLTQAGTCDSYLASTYTGLGSYDLWWGHLPNAIGVESAHAPQYTANGPNGVWNVSSSGCAQEIYAATFTITELLACAGPGNDTLVQTSTTTSPAMTYYSGTFYINLIAPLAFDKSETLGYVGASWSNAFQLSVTEDSVATIQVGGRVTALIQAVSTSLDSVGNLIVKVYLDVFQTAPAGYLHIVSASGVHADLLSGQAITLMGTIENGVSVHQAPFTDVIQYQFSPDDAGTFSGVYDGTYYLLFTFYQCSNLTLPSCTTNLGTATDTFDLRMRGYGEASAHGNYSTELTPYLNSSFGALDTRTVYRDSDIVCLLDNITNVNADDVGYLDITIEAFYLCGSNPSDPVTYDGVTHFGCLNQTAVATLILDTDVVQGVDPEYYGTTTYATPRGPGTVGVCFRLRRTIVDPATQVAYHDLGTSQFAQIGVTIERQEEEEGGGGERKRAQKRIVIVFSIESVSWYYFMLDDSNSSTSGPNNYSTTSASTVAGGTSTGSTHKHTHAWPHHWNTSWNAAPPHTTDQTDIVIIDEESPRMDIGLWWTAGIIGSILIFLVFLIVACLLCVNEPHAVKPMVEVNSNYKRGKKQQLNKGKPPRHYETLEYGSD